MTRLTADGIDHGDCQLEECLNAQIERFQDGHVWCPWLWSGGTCEECMEIFEQRQEAEDA